MSEAEAAQLEHEMDRMEEELEPLKSFTLPGGGMLNAFLHQARTVCRRAERVCWAVKRVEPINDHLLIYVNRLSDHLFVQSRWIAKRLGEPEFLWDRGLRTRYPKEGPRNCASTNAQHASGGSVRSEVPMANPEIASICDRPEIGPMANFVYLVGDPTARKLAVVDPAWDVGAICDLAEREGYEIDKILITHYHPDHLGGRMMGRSIQGAADMLAKVKAKVYVNATRRRARSKSRDFPIPIS